MREIVRYVTDSGICAHTTLAAYECFGGAHHRLAAANLADELQMELVVLKLS